MNDQIAERVARGVALLDQKRPGWAADIDLKYFDMASCSRCVIAQLSTSYLDGLYQLEISGEGKHYGFDQFGEGTYPLLAEAWRKVIEQRQAGNPSPEIVHTPSLDDPTPLARDGYPFGG